MGKTCVVIESMGWIQSMVHSNLIKKIVKSNSDLTVNLYLSFLILIKSKYLKLFIYTSIYIFLIANPIISF